MSKNPYRLARENKGKTLFVPFVVLGDPKKEQSLEIIKSLVESDADALELGLPFSDPPADGPVIQAAGTRALASGICIDDCFDILKEVRNFTDIPVGLLVYYNLVLQRGIEKFYADCTDAGVNSVLIADLPLEHASEVVPVAKKYGISPVMLVSELTTDERMEQIAKIAEGYLYVVSYVGVTGMENAVLEQRIQETLKRARKHTSLPLFVGFGINSPEQVKATANAGADGVIVGSRIVKEGADTIRVSEICSEFSSVI